jgi:hypothetical protein
MTLYVLINGPKRSGKTSLANAIVECNEEFVDNALVVGFSYHLKHLVHTIYLGESGMFKNLDYFDDVKEEPQEVLDGMSWREAYIHYSERVIKPLHGDYWFARQLVHKIKQRGINLVLVPDSGFRKEAEYVVREAGANNVLLLRMHRDGHDFAGDSRGYIDLSDLGVRCVSIQNVEGDMEHMHAAVITMVKEWYEERNS